MNQLRNKNKLYISAGERWNAAVASLIEVHLDDLSHIFLHFQVPFFLDINSFFKYEKAKILNQLRNKNKLYISAGECWNAAIASLIEVHLDDLSFIFLHFQVPFFLNINSCEAWDILRLRCETFLNMKN